MPRKTAIDGDKGKESKSFTGRTHPPVRQVSDLLTFQLARLVAINERAGARWFGREFGVSLNEWRVLGLAHAFGPVRTGRIARALLMDKGQLSRVVKGLVDKGHLQSRADANDARASLLETTDAGREVHARLLKYAAERNDKIVEPLTRKECETFIRLLAKLTAHNNELLESDELDGQA